MLDLALYSNTLVQRNGMWYAPRREQVYYPSDGHAHCFQIEENSFWFAHRNAIIFAGIQQLPPSGPLFDIGGGNGFVASHLYHKGIEVVVVEAGEEGLRRAKKRGLPYCICATLADAKFYPSSIPAVGMFDVIEHVEDAAGFLQQVYTIMQPHGMVYCTVPAFSWLWSAEDEYAGHFQRYTLPIVQHLFEQNGFRVHYQTYFFLPLVPAIFLLRRLPTLMGRRNVTEKAIHDRQTQKEHHHPFEKVIAPWWRYEQRAVRRARRLLIGTSCFVIAERREDRVRA